MADLLRTELSSGDVVVDAVAGKKPVSGKSPGQLAWRRFRRDKAGMIAGGIVVFFFVIGLGAPLISLLYGKNPDEHYGVDRGLLSDTGIPLKPNGGIDGDFWFGLEPGLGRDVLMQLVYGIRTSLLIALVVVALVTIVGTVIGITAGYLGGKTDYFVVLIIAVVWILFKTLKGALAHIATKLMWILCAFWVAASSYL
ncbi:hypothetical protein ACFQ1S_23825, partial [Kibdelosporangium lantanae]